MKKFVSIVTSAAAVMSCFAAVSANAEEYIPVVYMRAYESDVTVEADGTIAISRESLAEPFTLTTAVYIQDDLKKCWHVSPKWRCASEYLVIDNVSVPTPYAYSEKDDEGNITQDRISATFNIIKSKNIVNYLCQVDDFYNRSEMIPYGDNSDSYPLALFDITISPDTPDGVYEVYFITDAAAEGINKASEIAVRTDEGSVVYVPRTESMFIRIGDKPSYNLGDLNDDGKVDATDASDVLTAYANLSIKEPHGLTDSQALAADVNKDGKIDSTDASDILQYYAYASTTTGNTLGIEDFFAANAE